MYSSRLHPYRRSGGFFKPCGCRQPMGNQPAYSDMVVRLEAAVLAIDRLDAVLSDHPLLPAWTFWSQLDTARRHAEAVVGGSISIGSPRSCTGTVLLLWAWDQVLSVSFFNACVWVGSCTYQVSVLSGVGLCRLMMVSEVPASECQVRDPCDLEITAATMPPRSPSPRPGKSCSPPKRGGTCRGQIRRQQPPWSTSGTRCRRATCGGE